MQTMTSQPASYAGPATLVIDARGVVTLQIPLPSGEAIDYEVERAADGLDDWACLLARLDGKDSYRVSVSRGKWLCTCPDARHPGRPNRRAHDPEYRGPCKHVIAVRGVKRLLHTLT